MKLELIGHDYKYAAEQMMLTLYPSERPIYEGEGESSECTLTLHRGAHYVTSVCRLRLGDAEARGSFRVPVSRMDGEDARTRLEQRAVQFSFYRAAMALGHPRPVWGCLTGVRPGKFLAALRLKDGLSEKAAVRSLVRDYDVSPERAGLCAAAERHARLAKASLSPGDVCLYVGIPYCPTRCAYCSFVSVDAPKLLKTIPDYLTALRREMAAAADAVKRAGLHIAAVYVGGGTPTTLSAGELDVLLKDMETIFDLSRSRELTVEAGRPDTVTEEKLAVLCAHGVNRVSVNPQTMNDEVLRYIGRHHTAGDIVRAMEMVKKTPLQCNMDLIAGLPPDTPESFERTLRAVLALDPENITVHTLALKKGSRFLTEGTPLPGEKDVAAMLDASRSLLTDAGYGPYYLYRQKFMSGSFENVGWTKPGLENLYNICIMEELCGILAVGAGGSTKLCSPDGKVERLTAPKYPREYMEHIENTCASKEAIVRFYHSI